MTSLEHEKTKKLIDYNMMKVQVKKNASAFKKKELAKKLAKVILLHGDFKERKAHLMEEIIKSFFPSLVKVSISDLVAFLNTLDFELSTLNFFLCSSPMISLSSKRGPMASQS